MYLIKKYKLIKNNYLINITKMGCECQKAEENNNEIQAEKNNATKNEVEDISDFLVINNNNLSLRNHLINKEKKPEDEFSRYIFQKINALRQNPKSFIDTILQAKNNVIVDKSGINVYKSSVKVALNLGERAFDLAADILKKTEPMGKLIYSPDLTVEIPNNENDIKSRDYLPYQIQSKIDSGKNIKSFWKDIIKDPETCFILTVVDDSGQNPGNKRNDILDKNNEYIGISSVKIGRSFACYIVIG